MRWGLLLVVIGVVLGFVFMSNRSRVWLGRERFTVLNIGEGISIASFDPETKRGFVLKLPEQMEINSVQGRGKWKIRAVGELVGKFGSRWAIDSIGLHLGVMIGGLKTELGWVDRILWAWNEKIVEWESIDMDKRGWIKKIRAIDGEEIAVLSDKWRLESVSLWRSNYIANETLNFVVTNTTNFSGLGAMAARLVDSSGIKVRRIDNSVEKLDRCVVFSMKETRTKVGVRVYLQNWECEWKEDDSLEKSEALIKLGTLFQKRFGD